ncbi:MAG: ABC transporter permease, partial [Verrucomicrobiales bacterium]|nr:ABC transporter permease [Verrucomicrobiales bacterium]
AESRTFRGVIASQIEAVTVRFGGETEWLWAQPATANYFEVLGIPMALGRGFRADEDGAPGGNGVVVLGHGLWKRRFGSDPAVLGRVIEIARRPFTVIGVAPAEFRGTMGGLSFDLWYPVTMSSEHTDVGRAMTSRGIRWLHTIARLQDGVSIRQAQAATDTVMRRLEAAYPNSNRNVGVAVLPVWQAPWGAQGLLLPLMTVLAAMAILLQMLVIANVANLLLARATAREGEMSVRLALGAGASRLMRLVLVESLILAAAGGAAGFGVAFALRKSLLWFLPATYLPIRLEAGIDGRVLAFTAVVTLLTGLLFGLAPAWRATRANLADALKCGGRSGSDSRHGQRLRRILVVAEVAAAVVLLVGMALCARSFEKARGVYVGFEPSGLWVAGFRLPPGTFSEEQAADFYRRLRAELERIPSVTSVAYTDWLPLGFEGGSSSGFRVPGYAPAPGENVESGVCVVSSGYFETLRAPIVRGREFDGRDRKDSAAVVIVNEELARRYFAGRDALGQTLEIWGKPRTIVGVARTGRYRSLNEPPRSYLYLPLEQIGDHTLAAVVRTAGDPAIIAGALERTALALDPLARPMASTSMVDYMGAAYLVPKTAASILAVLGVAALLLSALGIYGVLATSVGRRIREVGIRMALGAERGSIHRLFLHQGFRLVGVGTAVGIVASLACGRLLGGLLVEVSALDAASYFATLPILAGITLLACWIP